jgi:thioester reductase-like protein
MGVAAQALRLERSAIDTVTALAARCLRVPPRSIPPDTPLSRLGLDSLGCIELGAALEEALGRTVPPEAIIESATIRSLCKALEHSVLPWLPPSGGRNSGHLLSGMRADAVLPEDIIPKRGLSTTDLRHAGTILLTGATGFLGTSLLRTLLDQTSSRIVCLVRATREPAARRIEPLIRDLPSGRDRVDTIEADLALPRLGLSRAEWTTIRGRIDAICHAGASISWVHPYEALRDVNVVATRDLLRLATEASASFHFVSSLSVCYSTSIAGSEDPAYTNMRPSIAGSEDPAYTNMHPAYADTGSKDPAYTDTRPAYTCAPPQVDESFDALDSLEGLHFGYAQTKAVAEALVLQARERGLRTRIYRPAIISGDSRSGRFNPEDLLSSLIAGCVRMGTAPDLDWSLDAVPVDCVADAIFRLSGSTGRTFHLAHPRPRHWRECALWMRLYGYDVRLVPYRDWAEQLRNEAAVDVDHPLRALRPFFLDRTHVGLSLPELHEDGRRPRAAASTTMRALARAGGSIAPLDAALMDRYFDAFVRDGKIPQVRIKRAVRPQPDTTHVGESEVTVLVRGMLADAGLRAREVSVVPHGSDDSIISELTAWRSGTASGVFRVLVDGRELILKVKPHARDSIAVGEALAGLCGERLASAFAAHGAKLGLQLGHVREIEIYRDPDPSFRAHLPEVLATRSDPAATTWAVLLERLPEAGSHVPRVGCRGAMGCKGQRYWRTSDVDVAIDGLAVIHARWLGHDAELHTKPWIGDVRSTSAVVQMGSLWSALAEHAAPLFASCASPGLPGLHHRLIERVSAWRPALQAVPQTLIHNDFNPRNICLRVDGGARKLCAFDWELATVGSPTRDLAEFLCFVARPDRAANQVPRWIERHRARLAVLTGTHIDRDAWRAAFRSALCELLIDRLSVYALVQRVRPQSFLPDVMRTWHALFRMYAHGDDDAFTP